MEKKNLDTSQKMPVVSKGRSRKKLDIDALRRDAGLQLYERLKNGELSTADLLKVMALCPPDSQQTKPKAGDWVLVLQGGERD